MQPEAERYERTVREPRAAEASGTGGANANAPKRLRRLSVSRRRGEELRALRELRPQAMSWAQKWAARTKGLRPRRADTLRCSCTWPLCDA